VIALEISSRNARVAALQKRWDRLRAGLELILDQRGADVAALPGGASETVRGYTGKEADKRPPRNWASGKLASGSASPSTRRRRRLRWRC
jgi:hypothetical protein